MPVLSLSSWEPWAFESLCVWGRSGGHPEAPAQGSFLRWSAAGGSGHLVRDGRWQPVFTLLFACSGDWRRFGLGGVLGLVLSSCLALFRGALRGSLPCGERR